MPVMPAIGFIAVQKLANELNWADSQALLFSIIPLRLVSTPRATIMVSTRLEFYSDLSR